MRQITRTLGCFLIIISGIQSLTYCQNKKTIDSLRILAVNEKSTKEKSLLYSYIAQEFHFNIPDSAIKYCYYGLNLGKKENNITDLAYFHNFLGVLFKNIGSYDSAVFHFNKAIELNKQDDFEKGVAASLNNLGQTLLLKGDYDKALNCYFSSFEIFEKYKDTLNIGILHSNIGTLLLSINEFEAAEEHFLLSQKQYIIAKSKIKEAWALYDLGNLKLKTLKYKEAFLYFEKAAIIWKKHSRINEFNNCLLRIGEIFMEQKLYSEAEILFLSAKKGYTKTNNIQGNSESLMLLGKAQGLQKKYDIAIVNLNKSLSLSDSVKSIQLQLEIYYELYLSYKKNKKYDSALVAFEQYKDLNDTVFSQNKRKIMAEYQTKLDLRNKETIIKDLEDKTQSQLLKNQNITLQNRQKQMSIYGLVIGIVVAISFLYIIYKRNKKNIVLNKKLTLSLREREVLIKEVHHRVKNNLQIISSLLNLQSEKSEGSNPSEILQISQSRIEAMSMIHETLYKSDNLSQISFKQYVENLCVFIEKSFNLNEKGILLQQNISPINIEIDKLVPCGLIINELVTNSIKHAFGEQQQQNKTISISCSNENNCVTVTIADNGKGLPENFDFRKTKSLGLRLANGLAKQLKSELVIENKKGFHASFEFKNNSNDN